MVELEGPRFSSSSSERADGAVATAKNAGLPVRARVSLACTDCGARNYQTTRKPERKGQLSLKKFCPGCNRHTVHKETK
jgi:large subunit ribosomal protein L33